MMRSILIWIAVFVFGLGLRSNLIAADEVDAIAELRIGIANQLKVGLWTPVEVALDSNRVAPSDRVRFETIDSDGIPVAYEAQLANTSHGSTVRAQTHVRFGSMTSALSVHWQRANGEFVAERVWAHEQLPPRLPTDHRIVMNIGAESGFEEAIGSQSRSSADPIAYVKLAHHQLPTSLLSYACIDAVVFATGDATVDWRDSPPEAWHTLAEWVRQGGRLIIGGSGSSTLLQDSNQDFIAIRELLPGQIRGVIPQRRTVGIEGFAEASVRLDRSANANFSIPMADLDQSRGRVELWEGLGTELRPCIVRASAGLGQIVFAAFDLDQNPIASWTERPKLAARLLSYVFDDGPVDESIRTEIGPRSHMGNTDLVGQLRGALDQFRNVRLIPFSWIAGIAAVYVLIMGPVDFWLLNRVKRLEWTWLTFTLTVAAFTLMATWLAFRWKGTNALIHHLTLIDADLATGESRGTTWSHLYSPRTQRIDLSYDAGAAFKLSRPRGRVAAWQGLPGDGFGGLNRNAAPSLFDAAYACVRASSDNQTAVSLKQFPIAVWSSRSVSGKWWGSNAWSQANNATQLRASNDGAISGQLVNPWNVDLHNVLLLHERWAYRIGFLPRNATLPIDVSMGVDLQSHLTDRQVAKGRNVVAPWDRQSTDVKRIVQLLSFYDAAKGRAYTQLKHRYHNELDWSHHLWNGQAILWGVCDEIGTEVQIDGRSVTPQETRTFCRLLIPLSLP